MYTPRFNNTTATPTICQCGAEVLRGYDQHLIATRATVDPVRATPADEAQAWLTHHTGTWQLTGTPGHYELASRIFPGQQHLDIASTADQVIVLIGHRCGEPPIATGPPVQLEVQDLLDLPDNPDY